MVTNEKIPKPLITSKKIIEQRTRTRSATTKDRPHSQARESDTVHVDINLRLPSSPIVNNKTRLTSSKAARVVKGEVMFILFFKYCVLPLVRRPSAILLARHHLSHTTKETKMTAPNEFQTKVLSFEFLFSTGTGENSGY